MVSEKQHNIAETKTLLLHQKVWFFDKNQDLKIIQPQEIHTTKSFENVLLK